MGPRRGERRHALKLPEERGAPRAARSKVLPATPVSMKEVKEAEEQPRTGCAAAPAAAAVVAALREEAEEDAASLAALKSARLPQPTADSRAERGACLRERSGRDLALRDHSELS